MAEDLAKLAAEARAWPFEEARKAAGAHRRQARRKRAMCCSRPAMARPACRISAPSARWCAPPWCATPSRRMSDVPTRLFAFSDDMDGLRKVPDNIPNQEMVQQHLGKPLTAIPDPFGTHESFGAPQQRAAARVPRCLRLRVRVPDRRPSATRPAGSTRRC